MASPAARRLYADQLRAQGPGLRNLADSIETGAHDRSFWVGPALAALDWVLRNGPPDLDELPS